MGAEIKTQPLSEYSEVSQIKSSCIPTAALFPMSKPKPKVQTKDEMQNKSENTEIHIFCF